VSRECCAVTVLSAGTAYGGARARGEAMAAAGSMLARAAAQCACACALRRGVAGSATRGEARRYFALSYDDLSVLLLRALCCAQLYAEARDARARYVRSVLESALAGGEVAACETRVCFSRSHRFFRAAKPAPSYRHHATTRRNETTYILVY